MNIKNNFFLMNMFIIERLKVFEGIPAPYDTKKRQCVP